VAELGPGEEESIRRGSLRIRQESGHAGASQGALLVKNLPVNATDIRDGNSVPGLERSPGGLNGWMNSPVIHPPGYGRQKPGYHP